METTVNRLTKQQQTLIEHQFQDIKDTYTEEMLEYIGFLIDNELFEMDSEKDGYIDPFESPESP